MGGSADFDTGGWFFSKASDEIAQVSIMLMDFLTGGATHFGDLLQQGMVSVASG